MGRERIKDLVSVVITNYNNGRYMPRCLESILNQSYNNIEVIIVDDKSKDNSVELIDTWIEENREKISSKFYNLEFVKLPKNVGFSGALTIAMYSSTGEFIAMQDGDDYSHPRRLERQVKFLEKNIKVGAVGTNYSVFSDDDPNPKNIPNFVRYGVEEIREIYAQGGNAVCHGTLVFRGEIFDRVGGLTRRIDGAEDYEYITKLLSSGVDNLKQSLYYYRAHEDQRSRQFYGSVSKKRAKVERNQISVLMIFDRFNLGGTETHVITLTKGFLKKGIKVTILADDGPLGAEFKKLGCKIYNMKFPFFVPKDIATINIYKQRIGQIIKAEDINMIHCHQSPSGALAIETGKELNIPTIFTIHGLYYDDIASDKLLKANNVIAVSHPSYEWLLKFGIQSKVVPNGVPFDEYDYEFDKMELRRKLNIPEDAIVAMYCSRLAWGKIQTCENLIRVTRDLRRIEGIDIHALIVGDGPGYDEMKGIADKVNRMMKKEVIHMVGGQLQMLDFYSVSDLVVGTGRVAIEGLAAKKPIIATGNIGYVGLVTKENFKECWKTYFGDHKSFKINNGTYLYEDLLQVYNYIKEGHDLGLETHELGKEMFDIDVVGEQIIDVYLDSF